MGCVLSQEEKEQQLFQQDLHKSLLSNWAYTFYILFELKYNQDREGELVRNQISWNELPKDSNFRLTATEEKTSNPNVAWRWLIGANLDCTEKELFQQFAATQEKRWSRYKVTAYVQNKEIDFFSNESIFTLGKQKKNVYFLTWKMKEQIEKHLNEIYLFPIEIESVIISYLDIQHPSSTVDLLSYDEEGNWRKIYQVKGHHPVLIACRWYLRTYFEIWAMDPNPNSTTRKLSGDTMLSFVTYSTKSGPCCPVHPNQIATETAHISLVQINSLEIPFEIFLSSIPGKLFLFQSLCIRRRTSLKEQSLPNSIKFCQAGMHWAVR